MTSSPPTSIGIRNGSAATSSSGSARAARRSSEAPRDRRRRAARASTIASRAGRSRTLSSSSQPSPSSSASGDPQRRRAPAGSQPPIGGQDRGRHRAGRRRCSRATWSASAISSRLRDPQPLARDAGAVGLPQGDAEAVVLGRHRDGAALVGPVPVEAMGRLAVRAVVAIALEQRASSARTRTTCVAVVHDRDLEACRRAASGSRPGSGGLGASSAGCRVAIGPSWRSRWVRTIAATVPTSRAATQTAASMAGLRVTVRQSTRPSVDESGRPRTRRSSRRESVADGGGSREPGPRPAPPRPRRPRRSRGSPGSSARSRWIADDAGDLGRAVLAVLVEHDHAGVEGRLGVRDGADP